MAAYEKGLIEVADGSYAYLQPHGGWGLSNAGLVVDGEESLLVDTLFDERHTREMLAAMRRVSNAAEAIDTLVNTHANGDHCWGNSLVRDSRIVASEACAREISDLSPKRIALLMKLAHLVAAAGSVGGLAGRLMGRFGLKTLADLIDAAPFVLEAFSQFDFEGVEPVIPNQLFTQTLTLHVGDVQVDLFEVGPAHTQGDVIAYLPSKKLVFTGDILFHDAHPVMWAGPVSNWIAACEKICSLDVDVVVPGHGALTDNRSVERCGRYFRYLRDEARKRFDVGMGHEEAARDIDLSDYRDWTEGERVVVNVQSLYREFSGQTAAEDDLVGLFGAMARAARET
jgi:cyclase